MRRGRVAALLLTLSGCGAEPQNQAERKTGTVSVALQSEDAIDGRRPVLTLACGPASASFWLELVRVPEAVTAQRAHGTIKIDDGPPQRIGLFWLGGDKWAPALDAASESALARAMVGARSIYFLGPEGTTERPYRWDMGRIGNGAAELRSRCG